MAMNSLKDEWYGTEGKFRDLVRVMRELGVAEAFGIVLGPEPRQLQAIPATLPEAALTPDAKRAARIEEARAAVRDRIGNWDLPNERIDRFIDPAVFEE